ncbi:type VI secretion system baseplate subunit TssE [Pseudomonas viridiflava]|nr:type VI secretion system baseplate subunit TssE [Pseudomonas viridiflava]
MSRCGSLFERLGGLSEEWRGLDREACSLASIAAHLSRLLSTREGSVKMLADYGLPDLNDRQLSLHDTLRQSQKKIEHFVRTYEPRLSDIRVVAEPQASDALVLTFSIRALLNVDGLKKDVVFHASLNGRGMTAVSCH